MNSKKLESLTPELEKKLLVEHSCGKSYRQLGREYGFNRITINKRLKKRGVVENPFSMARYLTAEYLNNPKMKLSEIHRADLNSWVEENLDKLTTEERFRSSRQEQDITRRETSPLGDWREDWVDKDQD